jgi:hypothetical protein
MRRNRHEPSLELLVLLAVGRVVLLGLLGWVFAVAVLIL